MLQPFGRAANAACAAADADDAFAAASAASAATTVDARAAATSRIANHRQDLIAYIESTIIPVYTTMKVEPGFRNECLVKIPS